MANEPLRMDIAHKCLGCGRGPFDQPIAVPIHTLDRCEASYEAAVERHRLFVEQNLIVDINTNTIYRGAHRIEPSESQS